MVVVDIKIEEKNKNFLQKSDKCIWIVEDYIEKKQDEITKKKLDNDLYFRKLNKALEKKLCKL